MTRLIGPRTRSKRSTARLKSSRTGNTRTRGRATGCTVWISRKPKKKNKIITDSRSGHRAGLAYATILSGPETRDRLSCLRSFHSSSWSSCPSHSVSVLRKNANAAGARVIAAYRLIVSSGPWGRHAAARVLRLG